MTYLPSKPATTTAATALADANTLTVTQAGAAKTMALLTLKTYVLGSSSSTSSTGSTGGSTGSTAPTGSTSPGSTTSTGSTGGGTVPTGSGQGGLYTYPQGQVGPFGGIGDTGTGAGPQAYLYGRSLGDLFGTYTYPNPQGLDGGKTIRQNLEKLANLVGVFPKTMNAFNNFNNDLNNIGAGTFANAWAVDVDAATVSGPNGYLRPIIGVKLNGNAQGDYNFAVFDDIVKGLWDSQYLTEVNAWIDRGYKNLTYRYAYEFNGHFMQDWMGNNPTDQARFAAALRHVILLVKNRCMQAGVSAKFTWNPSSINESDAAVMNAWPGDDVVDIIDTDFYNHAYPRMSAPGDFTDFDANGNLTGTLSPDLITWLANVNNRRHYWAYPGVKLGDPNQPGGWSVLQAIALAKVKGKPISFSECGTGAKGSDLSVAIPNDVEWVKFFWQMCQSAISQGVSIAHMNIWNVYAVDGQWEFSAPDSYDPQPDVARAYRKYFGDGSFPGGPTPVSGNGTTPTVTSGTGATGTPTAAPTPAAGPASIRVTDTAGHTATLSLPANPAVNNTTGHNWQTFYTTTTSLSTNVNYFIGSDGNRYVDADTDSQIASAVLTLNGLSITSLMPAGGTTTPTAAPAPVSSGSGPASAVITDTAGKTATISLENPPVPSFHTFYAGDTGLRTNINWFVGNDGGYYLDGATDTDLASAVVTKNGVAVVSLIPNSTYK